jgi:hypothetical protein
MWNLTVEFTRPVEDGANIFFSSRILSDGMDEEARRRGRALIGSGGFLGVAFTSFTCFKARKRRSVRDSAPNSVDTPFY